MYSAGRDRYYDGFGTVNKGRGREGVPLSMSDYLGKVAIDKANEYSSQNLLPTSLQGVDSYGRALVPTASANFTVALVAQIASIGDEVFRLFATEVVSPIHANRTIQGKIYPVSPMDPTTEHTTGTTFTQYGYSISRFMGHFAKFIQFSVEFLQTEEGKQELFQRLKDLSESYVLTAVATIIQGLMILPDLYKDWTSKIPGARSNYSATREIEESVRLFAFTTKGTPDVISSVIAERAPSADTMIISKQFASAMMKNRTRDPMLFQDSTFPVYQGEQAISYLLSLPSLPTGVGLETKDMLQSRASYVTFKILPPISAHCDVESQGAGSLTFYDHRAKQTVTISRKELYRNIAYDNVDPAADAKLAASDDQYTEHIEALEDNSKSARLENLSKEGFVVLEVYSWETRAALACNRSKIKFLTTEPQAIEGVGAQQNTYELHLRTRMGTHSADAGQSALCFHSPFVCSLASGGSARFYRRADLRTENNNLLAPRFSANGLIVIRVTADQIRGISDQLYIPPLGGWTAEAKAAIGNEPIINADWSGDADLDSLANNFKKGEFALGSFDTARPKLPEVCFRDGYIRSGFFADQSQPSVTAIEGCAPHGDLTTAEIKGETPLRTRSIENPEVFKRARFEQLAG